MRLRVRWELILLCALTAAAPLGATAQTSRPSEHRQLIADLDAFAVESATMSPRTAASRWLRLYERACQRWDDAGTDSNRRAEARLATTRLMESLPPPAAWPELNRQIEGLPRPNQNENRVRHVALLLLGQMLDATDRNRESREQTLQWLRDTVINNRDAFSAGAAIHVATLEELIGAASDAEGIIRKFRQELQEYGDDINETLDVPDLYRLANPAVAESLAKQAIQSRARLVLSGGTYTDRRMITLARDSVSSLQVPRYEFIRDAETLDLYEPLQRRFPGDAKPGPLGQLFGEGKWKTPDRMDDWRGARRMLLARALRTADTDEILRLCRLVMADQETAPTQGLSGELARMYEAIPWTGEQFERVLRCLQKEPRAPVWDAATTAAVATGNTEKVHLLIRETAMRPDVSEAWRLGLERRESMLLLRIGRIDDSVESISRRLAQPLQPPDVDDGLVPSDLYDDGVWYTGQMSELAHVLARLAVDLGKPQLIEEAIVSHRKAVAEANAHTDKDRRAHSVSLLADTLKLAGRSPEAIRELAAASSRLNADADEPAYSFQEDIVQLYNDAGRHREVVQLLDESEDWSTGELRELMYLGIGTFGVAAAESLTKGGQRAAGLNAFEHLLSDQTDMANLYPRLLSSAGDDLSEVVAILDRVSARSPSSATPLAWKAEALRRLGKPAEAEAAARQSLTRWPTDAVPSFDAPIHQAHRTLAALLADRGRDADAATHRAAATAAEIAGKAAIAQDLGLSSTAIEQLERALKVYPDWPEARVQLAELHLDMGRVDAAIEHATHAAKALLKYPLRHWDDDLTLFGFFHRAVLRDAVASVAEARLAEEPGDVNAMFLRSLALSRADAHAEAAVALRGVVMADPDHLPAWVMLQFAAATVAERSDAALQVLRLDRTQGSPQFGGGSVVDLKRLWTAAAAQPALNREPLKSIYPLSASAKRIQAAGRQHRDEPPSPSIPGRTVANTSLVRSLQSLIFAEPSRDF